MPFDGRGYGATAVDLAMRHDVSVLGLTVSLVQEHIAQSRTNTGFTWLRHGTIWINDYQ